MSMQRDDVERGRTTTTAPPGTAATAAPTVVAVHEEIDVSRRDRIRWGPVWAGLVVALSTYLLLQLALIAVGLVDLSGDATSDAVWSAIAAVIAFFLGGLTAGATAMWRGADDGLLHGVVVWGVGLIALLVLSVAGSGLALGSIDTTQVYDQFSADQVSTAQANDNAQDASGKALGGLVVALVASAGGGVVGAKLWPRRDRTIDLRSPSTTAR
jgi:hypothetical protein